MKTNQQETPALKYQNDKGFMLSFKRSTQKNTSTIQYRDTKTTTNK